MNIKKIVLLIGGGMILISSTAFNMIGRKFEPLDLRNIGEKGYFITAEFPYYRLNPNNWQDRLRKIKAAGIDYITFYVPWNLHEPSEGLFDFTGVTRKQTNLKPLLRILKKMNIYAIVKPGPFICAEVSHGGIPDWVTKNDKIIMKTALGGNLGFRQDGKPLPIYLSSSYLKFVSNWYETLAKKIIIKNQYPNGPIVAIQIENEIPYSTSELADPFSWGYDGETVKMYIQWLTNVYKNIANYNNFHNTSFRSFDCIFPPVKWDCTTLKQWLNYQDWVMFKNYYVAKVLEIYSKILLNIGVNLPFYHNYLMLDDESPTEFSKINKVIYGGPNYWLPASPLYDEHSFFEGLKRLYMANASLSSKSYIPEMNWGWGNASEYSFLAKYLLHATSGFNVYPIVDSDDAGILNGRKYSNNPEPYPGTAPIDETGVEREAYYSLKKLTTYLNKVGTRLVTANNTAKVCIVYSPLYNYPRAYVKWGKIGRSELTSIFGEMIDINESLYYMIKAFYSENVSFKLINLDSVKQEELNKYQLAFVLSYSYMKNEGMEKLSRYVENGGTMVLGPDIPYMDEFFKPSNTLGSILTNIHSAGEVKISKPFPITIKSNDECFKVSKRLNYFSAPAENTLASYQSKPFFVSQKYGKGKVYLIGFNYFLTSALNTRVFDKITKENEIESKEVLLDSNGIYVNVEKSGDGIFVFVINRSKKIDRIAFTVRDEKGILRKIEVSTKKGSVSIIELKEGEVMSAFVEGENNAFVICDMHKIASDSKELLYFRSVSK